MVNSYLYFFRSWQVVSFRQRIMNINNLPVFQFQRKLKALGRQRSDTKGTRCPIMSLMILNLNEPYLKDNYKQHNQWYSAQEFARNVLPHYYSNAWWFKIKVICFTELTIVHINQGELLSNR